MKKIFTFLFSSIAILFSSQAALITYNATPTIGSTNTSFNFSLFDSDLGTLTAVDLILNSSTAGGSVSIDTNSSGEDADFTNLTAFLRTSGTGLPNQSTTPITLSLNVALPTTIPADSNQSFTVTGSPSFIPTAQTYSINSANWGSYQVSGGGGNTPNFIGRAFTSFSITAAVQPTTSNSFFTAASSYTLRYTYTPSAAVPEPSQVAASLLVAGGIGLYFLRRRRMGAVSSN